MKIFIEFTIYNLHPFFNINNLSLCIGVKVTIKGLFLKSFLATTH